MHSHIGNKIDGTVQSSTNVFNLRYKTEQMRFVFLYSTEMEKTKGTKQKFCTGNELLFSSNT